MCYIRTLLEGTMEMYFPLTLFNFFPSRKRPDRTFVKHLHTIVHKKHAIDFSATHIFNYSYEENYEDIQLTYIHTYTYRHMRTRDKALVDGDIMNKTVVIPKPLVKIVKRIMTKFLSSCNIFGKKYTKVKHWLYNTIIYNRCRPKLWWWCV